MGIVSYIPVIVHRCITAAMEIGMSAAQAYLRQHEVRGVECGDLATGRDMDQPGES